MASKALMSEPADRWASATEMLAAVAKVLPDWDTLTEEMLVPTTDAERAVVAPISDRIAGTKATSKNEFN